MHVITAEFKGSRALFRGGVVLRVQELTSWKRLRLHLVRSRGRWRADPGSDRQGESPAVSLCASSASTSADWTGPSVSEPIIWASFAKPSAPPNKTKPCPEYPWPLAGNKAWTAPVLLGDTYEIGLQRRVMRLDPIAQDGHHHPPPSVASPPGPGDGGRRQAARGAVDASLQNVGR